MAILGVWMWPQSVRVHGAEKVVSHCARAGVTDIYFLTKGMAGTVAYHSAFAPHMCERDLLRELLDRAHGCGIRVHAWFTSASDEQYKTAYPESGRCHFVKGKNQGLISLVDAGYLAYMERVTAELCRGYDVDGLHLDYIRYNHLLYGWDEGDMARYAAEGADIAHLRDLVERTCYKNEEQCIFDAYRNGDQSVLAFARARRKDVVQFATRLTKLACAEKSGLTLSAALMPEGAYEDIAFSDVHYGQNYQDAAGLYDYALPMAYSKAYDKDSAWVRMVAEGTMKHGMKTIMGLHAYEGGTGLSLREDIAALGETAIAGICLFREGATAMAYADGKNVSVYNALDENITAVTALHGGESFTLSADILPGEEKRFELPFAAEALRVFAGESEKCVYLTTEKAAR